MSEQDELNGHAQIQSAGMTDRPVLLFAGQGSQRPDMGQRLAESDSRAMQLWKVAEKASGLPLREIYWSGASEDAMKNTAALQPALTAFTYNLWDALKKRTGMKPFAAAGHSLGEFSALAAAGAISPERAVELTALRGRLMAQADPEGKGAMAAIVRLGSSEVCSIVAEAASETGDLIIAANYNTPVQLVVSGTKAAVELVCKKARERKAKAVTLPVSGAFHSPLMEDANRQFSAALENTTWRDPDFPVYCNVDAEPARSGLAAKRNLLLQMVSPVRWVDTVRNLYRDGARWWLEISPRPVLGKMVNPNLAGLVSDSCPPRVDLLDSFSGIQTIQP